MPENSLQDSCAFAVFENLGNFGEDVPLIGGIHNTLTSLYNFSSLNLLPTPELPDVLPKGLVPVKSACKTILNKLCDSETQEETEDLFFDYLIEGLYENKKELKNYDDFVQDIVNILMRED